MAIEYITKLPKPSALGAGVVRELRAAAGILQRAAPPASTEEPAQTRKSIEVERITREDAMRCGYCGEPATVFYAIGQDDSLPMCQACYAHAASPEP